MAKARNDISIVAIIKNEADHLRIHLPVWKQICEDIILVDSGSTDDSRAISELHHCTFITTPWLGYGETKNLGNSHAKNDWILSLDADELPDEKLLNSILTAALKRGHVYEVNRLTSYCGKFIYHCGWHPMPLLRLFHRQEWKWNAAEVHERLIGADVYKRIKLAGKLLHFSFISEAQHLYKLHNYAKLKAQDWVKKNKKPRIGRKTFGPIIRFIRSYFLKLGFMDGKAGYTICKNEAKMIKWQVEKYERMDKK